MFIDLFVSLFYGAILAAFVGCIAFLCAKHWQFTCCLMTVVVFVCMFMFIPGCIAEDSDMWRVEVVNFDLETAEVILEDEDGYLWTCPFGTSDWAIGEEYLLVFRADGSVDIESIEE